MFHKEAIALRVDSSFTMLNISFQVCGVTCLYSLLFDLFSKCPHILGRGRGISTTLVLYLFLVDLVGIRPPLSLILKGVFKLNK